MATPYTRHDTQAPQESTQHNRQSARGYGGPPYTLTPVVPATPSIQFQGIAEILERPDEEGLRTFEEFFMGRRILKMYEEFERRGEARVCFLRIVPDSEISTYMVGQSIWEMSRRMEAGIRKVEVTATA
jgi:hypothetical protein